MPFKMPIYLRRVSIESASIPIYGPFSGSEVKRMMADKNPLGINTSLLPSPLSVATTDDTLDRVWILDYTMLARKPGDMSGFMSWKNIPSPEIVVELASPVAVTTLYHQLLCQHVCYDFLSMTPGTGKFERRALT